MVKGWRPWMSEAERERFDSTESPLGSEHYDRQGDPISFADWIEAFEDLGYRRIGEDITNGWRISTVWLGLDHGFGGEPLIFETMIFDETPEGKAENAKLRERWSKRKVDPATVLGPDAYQQRYATEAEAIKGHRQAVVAAEAGLIRREDRD